MRRALWVAALGAVFALAGCGGEMMTGDTGPTDTGGGTDATDTSVADTRTDTPATDTRTDATGDSSTGNLFRRCTSNADCGAGLTCNLAFPGGLCTTRCTSDRACGAQGICAGMNGCLPACQPGNDDCGPFSGICFIFDPADMNRRACFPSCYETPPTGFPACVMGRVCDPNSGSCSTPPLMPMGAADGSPCTAPMDCRGGRCYPVTDMASGNPTGWTNGYCFTVGRTPANEDFMMGMPWPRSNCPMGSVALPAGAMPAAGDPALCLRECRMDSDCRVAEGYRCFRGTNMMMPGMPVFASGGCLPLDCSMMGMTCPSGYSCRTIMGTTRPYGVCVPMGGSDAGMTDVPAGG